MFAKFVLIGFDLVEEMLVEAIRPHAASNGGGSALTDVRAILSLFVMAFASLIPFFGVTGLSNARGQEKMRKLFFGSGAGF